ncbi:hypothetical protein ZOSMA_235G00110 [Zostera marina]|uniref:Uncharacterized protein n=1 Tax=Zostera marina TaxID=29655 RepID=A0A0K9PK66_ZOSMR|nr:hypothetical protein ZOSMA_235G00110 [Zostera marina]
MLMDAVPHQKSKYNKIVILLVVLVVISIGTSSRKTPSLRPVVSRTLVGDVGDFAEDKGKRLGGAQDRQILVGTSDEGVY